MGSRGAYPDPVNRGDRRRRRTRRGSWLQRNIISIAGVFVVFVLLGVGFGLAQIVSRAPAVAHDDQALPLSQATAGPAATTPNAPAAPASDSAAATTPNAPGSVQFSSHALDPNYTVASGDNLVTIAQQFNTTADRISALNKLSDPRVLHVGQQLVIPPAL